MRKVYLLLFAIFFTLVASSQTVTIGTGTITSSNSPWNSYYGYSYIQTIYLQSEISATGNITSISYYYAGTALGNSDSITVYMGMVSKNSFSSTTDWVPLSSLIQVYKDRLTGYTVPGWITIPLTTPFAYNGTGNLLIAVDENQPNYDGSTRFQGTTMTPASRVLGYWSDVTNPDPSNPPATGTVLGSIVGNVQIDGLTLLACQPPSNLSVTNATTTGADATWDAPTTGNTPTQYNWEVRTSGAPGSGATGLAASGNAATNMATITGLMPSIAYSFYVRSDCGTSGTASWAGPFLFNTVCTGVSTFFENFDAVTPPAFPTCWFKVGTGGATYPQVSTRSFSSPNNLYIYGSVGSQAVVSMPPVNNADSGTHWLRFKAMANFTVGGIVEVGYLTVPTDSSSFVLIDTFSTVSTTAYKDYSIIPVGLPSGDVTLAFRHSGNGYSVLIDDVSWTLIPSCFDPVAPYAWNITMNTATISWTAPSAPPPTYDVFYTTSSVLPTTATTPTIANITDTTTNVTGLAAATKYYFYVRSNCGTSLSNWTARDSFYTLCNAVNVPYTQNFESAVPPALPLCTSRENAGSGNNWTIANNPGSGFTTNTLQYIYNSTYAADAWFYTQGINLTAGTSYRLSFNYGNNSTLYTEKLEVKYGNAPTFSSMNDLIVNYPMINMNMLQNSTTDFIPSVSGVYYLGFHAYSAIDQDRLYVDDISVTLTPTCDAPTGTMASNITTTDAQIDWVTPVIGNPVSYDLYYSTNNTAPADTTTPSVTNIPATTTTLTNLMASTTYYVWVRSNCGAQGKSSWSVMYSFSTACGIVATPSAIEQFNTFTPGCWSEGSGVLGNPSTIVTSTSNWTQDDFGNVTSPVNKAARLNIYSTSNNDWLFTPVYDLDTTHDKKLEFDLAMTKYALTTAGTLGSDDKFAVLISTDTGVTWTDANVLRMWDTTTAISNTGEHVVIDLSGYTGLVKFAFYGESTINGNGDNDVFVDNVKVSKGTAQPVTLLSFKGERAGASNRLMWSTATEQNNKGFELQRSANGSEFATIGYVKSNAIGGNSTSTINYVFTDGRPSTGNNYYRLKEINNDNKTTLSNVVLIKGVRASLELTSLYPNPVKSKLNVLVAAPATDKINFIVTDLAGKVVMQQAYNVSNGDNNVSLNVERLPSGSYMLKAVCRNGCETAVSKFVKQ